MSVTILSLLFILIHLIKNYSDLNIGYSKKDCPSLASGPPIQRPISFNKERGASRVVPTPVLCGYSYFYITLHCNPSFAPSPGSS